jgi:hypothetical protein
MLYLVNLQATSEICATEYSAEVINMHRDMDSLNALLARRYYAEIAPPLCIRSEEIENTPFSRTMDYEEYENGFHESSKGFKLEPFDFDYPVESWGAEVEFRAVADFVLMVESASEDDARNLVAASASDILYFEMNNIGDEYEVESLDIYSIRPASEEDLKRIQPEAT